MTNHVAMCLTTPKGQKGMAQSISKILLHLVFSTKNREGLIPITIRADLHAYIAGTCKALGSQVYRVGGTDDHVHIACTLPRTLTVAKLLEEIKKSSSSWVKDKDPRCGTFSWQAGYAAFSLGESQLETVVNYIERQVEHHKSTSFKDELLLLLERYRIEYEERYLWD